MHNVLANRTLYLLIILVILVTTANEASLVVVLEHSKKAFANRLSHDVVFVSFSSLLLILISQLCQHLRFDFSIAGLLKRDVIKRLLLRKIVECLVKTDD